MTRKTEGVQTLVQDVLRTIHEPYGEDVILDVCVAIENNHNWRRRYDRLEVELAKAVVNNWIGKYTKEATGLKTIWQIPAPAGHIIGSYTKLGH